jgi:hypothetical protein
LSRESFFEHWTEDSIRRPPIVRIERFMEWQMINRKSEVINEMNDYVRIDDFYSNLAERSSYIIKGKIDNTKLMKLNEKCLELAEDALEIIDWSKYK